MGQNGLLSRPLSRWDSNYINGLACPLSRCLSPRCPGTKTSFFLSQAFRLYFKDFYILLSQLVLMVFNRF